MRTAHVGLIGFMARRLAGGNALDCGTNTANCEYSEKLTIKSKATKMYAYLCRYIHKYITINVHISTYVCAFATTHTHTDTHTYTHTHAHVYI